MSNQNECRRCIKVRHLSSFIGIPKNLELSTRLLESDEKSILTKLNTKISIEVSSSSETMSLGQCDGGSALRENVRKKVSAKLGSLQLVFAKEKIANRH